MVEQCVGWLVIAMGLIAAAVGIAVAIHRLQTASRVYHRTAILYDAMPEGWTSWFLKGFSTLSVGSHWVLASLLLIGWMTAGACLVGLGLRLFWR